MKQCALADLSAREQRLVNEAVAVRQKAYAPYSHYKVGAALWDDHDQLHTGCNVEGADFTLTTHAEMSALNAMVKSGVLKLKVIAVAVKSDIGHGMPCGLCRQKIKEFSADRQVRVIGINLDAAEQIQAIFVSDLEELLPYSFGPNFL